MLPRIRRRRCQTCWWPPHASQQGTSEVFGQHAYATTGSFTVSVSIVDFNTGATATATSTAIVDPQLVASGVTWNTVHDVVAPAPATSFVVASVVDRSPSIVSVNTGARITATSTAHVVPGG